MEISYFDCVKKSYARVLACVAEKKEEGITVDEVIVYLKIRFNKDCTQKTAEFILATLVSVGFVTHAKSARAWVCTEKGLKEYDAILRRDPDRLKETSSPQIKMHA